MCLRPTVMIFAVKNIFLSNTIYIDYTVYLCQPFVVGLTVVGLTVVGLVVVGSAVVAFFGTIPAKCIFNQKKVSRDKETDIPVVGSDETIPSVCIKIKIDKWLETTKLWRITKTIS